MSLISPWPLGRSVTSIGNPSCELEVDFSNTDVEEASSNTVAVITSLEAVDDFCICLGSKLGRTTGCCG